MLEYDWKFTNRDIQIYFLSFSLIFGGLYYGYTFLIPKIKNVILIRIEKSKTIGELHEVVIKKQDTAKNRLVVNTIIKTDITHVFQGEVEIPIESSGIELDDTGLSAEYFKPSPTINKINDLRDESKADMFKKEIEKEVDYYNFIIEVLLLTFSFHVSYQDVAFTTR
jgi:hypothetical protein